MNAFSIVVYTRGNDRVPLPAGVTFAPRTWSASATGGPTSAEVMATGGAGCLAGLANWIGCSLWIVSPDSEYVWFGDITEIVMEHQGTTSGVTLEGVANRIKVLYTDDAPGGEMTAAETAWAADAESIALYGLRERQHAVASPMRLAQAERIRDTLLGLNPQRRGVNRPNTAGSEDCSGG